MKNKYYYWIDTEFLYGDSTPKFALYRGEYEDGKKNRETEEVILWETYENVDGVVEATKNGDINLGWDLIDEYIKDKLGFLPDYEIN